MQNHVSHFATYLLLVAHGLSGTAGVSLHAIIDHGSCFGHAHAAMAHCHSECHECPFEHAAAPGGISLRSAGDVPLDSVYSECVVCRHLALLAQALLPAALEGTGNVPSRPNLVVMPNVDVVVYSSSVPARGPPQAV